MEIASRENLSTILNEVADLQGDALSDVKSRQEILSLRIQNELRQAEWRGLLSSIGAVFIGLLTAWIGLAKYLDSKQKERLDRAATDMNAALKQLAGESHRERALGVVALQHFLTDDKREYHLLALSALVAAARLEAAGEEPSGGAAEVLKALGIALAQAAKQVDLATLRSVSWEGVQMVGLDLSGADLSGLDLRNANLENSRLPDAKLTGSQLENANLNGADLRNADLSGAYLRYAGLEGADISGAKLDGAVLNDARVLNLLVTGADLRNARFSLDDFPWEKVTGWYEAQFTPAVLNTLISRYGPRPTGPRIAMLMWKLPPFVAGGTWTASYHLVRKLRLRGVRLVVIVPWEDADVASRPFGLDVEVVTLGLKTPGPRQPAGSMGTAHHGFSSGTSSPYGSPYGGWYSPYPWSRAEPAWSPYSRYREPPSAGWPFGGYALNLFRSAYSAVRLVGRRNTLQWLMEKVGHRLRRYADQEKAEGREFELIHAHDWITFSAAEGTARHLGIPWVAHFHSTESERRSGGEPGDPDILDLERIGVEANGKVTPSRRTAAVIATDYNVAADSIRVIANSFSVTEVDPEEMGAFDTRRVVFLGRLTSQKGPDLFVEIAQEAIVGDDRLDFSAYGSGELEHVFDHTPVNYKGSLEWGDRGQAFSDASVVIVPSRAEPFGMVIIEAMLHRVPVFYTREAGVAEHLDAGIPIDIWDPAATANRLVELLNDRSAWNELVEHQLEALKRYSRSEVEAGLVDLWDTVAAATSRD